MKKRYKGLIAVLSIILIFCVGTVVVMFFKPAPVGETNHVDDKKRETAQLKKKLRRRLTLRTDHPSSTI